MEKLVIRIHPRESDEGLLRVADAMEQVLDLLRLHDAARGGVARTEEPFEWRLERAATNSPLTITARAEPRDPHANVDDYVRLVTREFRAGFDDLVRRGTPAWWMDPDSVSTAARILERNENGVGLTEVVPQGQDVVEPLRIDRDTAVAGIKAIAGVDVLSIEAMTGESEAWGEVRGVLVNAGVYRRQPALRILTPDYGSVWCRLQPEVAATFGHDKTLDEAWKGVGIAVEGRLIYGAGGRLTRIIAIDVRELAEPPRVDLDSVIDGNFTEGMDPIEYLRRLHEGELA